MDKVERERLSAEMAEFFSRPEIQAGIQEALQDAHELCALLKEARQVTPEMLHTPMTI